MANGQTLGQGLAHVGLTVLYREHGFSKRRTLFTGHPSPDVAGV
jgi:hypothetical protein